MTRSEMESCIFFLERVVPRGESEADVLIHLVEKLRGELKNRENKRGND
jgi:hypothetical protein